jgi:hypothetical protein
MKLFNVNNDITIVCEWVKTRNAFKHTATLMRKGIEDCEVKICYSNRTWESYEFQSVILKLADKVGGKDGQLIHDYAKNYNESDSFLKTVGLVASLGELMCNTQEERNDWKVRMIKAGLGDSGIEIPEDWDTLSEDEKEKRLNGVIEVMNSK